MSKLGPESGYTRHRFTVLDGLRGLAAIAVVEFHITPTALGFHRAYLAVDFFFLLSGFVMSFTYGQRLMQGWSAKQFLRARVIRLYPLYFAALLLGLAANSLLGLLRQSNTSWVATVFAFFPGMLFLPFFTKATYAFPLNIPSWSLFGELVANVIHAVLLRRASCRTLVLLFLASATLLIAFSFLHHSLDFGAFSGDVLPSVLRVLTSYILGILLERWHRTNNVRVPGAMLLAPLGLMLALSTPLRLGFATDLVTVLLFFPAILLTGATVTKTGRFSRPLELLGLTSYALYVLQRPSFILFHLALPHGNSEMTRPFTIPEALIFSLVLLLVCWLADRFYDFPVRALLNRFRSAPRAEKSNLNQV
jgi:peptidoglycan/LPS O-acetylase OafA/YrhL